MTSNAAGLNRPSEAHFLHSNADVKTLEESGGMPIAHGEGIYVFDLDGNRYFEAISGTWHLAFGFSEQRLTDAVNAQMASLPAYHAFFGRVGEPVLHLADRLSKIAPMPTGKVFFSHSGFRGKRNGHQNAVADQLGQGSAREAQGHSRQCAYHGSTMLAASLSGRDYIQAFGLPIDEILFADIPHHWRYAEHGQSEEDYATRLAGRLNDLITREGAETVAAFIADPSMASGGVVPPPRWLSRSPLIMACCCAQSSIPSCSHHHSLPLTANSTTCSQSSKP